MCWPFDWPTLTNPSAMKIDVKPITNTMCIVGWSPILLEVNVSLLLYLRKVCLKHVEVPITSDRQIKKDDYVVLHHILPIPRARMVPNY